jgi:hypothetical protein
VICLLILSGSLWLYHRRNDCGCVAAWARWESDPDFLQARAELSRRIKYDHSNKPPVSPVRIYDIVKSALTHGHVVNDPEDDWVNDDGFMNHVSKLTLELYMAWIAGKNPEAIR